MSSILLDNPPVAPENPPSVWQSGSKLRTPERQANPHVVPTVRGLEIRIPIKGMDDIVVARRSGRLLARQMGCSDSSIALFLTAISELARNIISYASSGELVLSRSRCGDRETVVVTAKDRGPGIADVAQLSDRPATDSGRVGLGLSGLKQCMNRFEIDSRVGFGTQVTCELIAG